MTRIKRRNLRDDVREELVRRLINGALPAGTDVREAELADELGVSRTPLREALLTLEDEGFLEARPGRGWWVPPLNERTVREVYPIITALELLALRSADPAELARVVPKLNAINAEMRDVADDPIKAQRVDDRWHATLLSTCDNQRLLAMNASLKRVVHRYEYAYMSADRSVPVSTEQHDAIAAAIASGLFDEAERILDANWRHGMELLVVWLTVSS